MKKILSLIISLPIFFFVFLINIDASEYEEVYKISSRNSEYILSLSKENEEELLVGDIKEIMNFLNESEDKIIINFNAITLSEELNFLNKEYTVSGEISVGTGGSINVSAGACVIFDGVNISFLENSEEGILLNGGKLTLRNSMVTNLIGSPITVSSLDSVFSFESGELISGYSSAIKIKTGTCEIKGGKIRSLSTEAIYNDDILFLTGMPEINGVGGDILTSCKIYLSKNGEFYNNDKSLRVKYNSNFIKGYMTPLVCDASENIINKIKVLSLDDEEYTLSFFEKYQGLEEKNFGAVYLPFSLKVFEGENLIYEEKRLSGELFSGEFYPSKLGYEFTGLYFEEDLLKLFNESSPITSDLILFAGYKLLAPEVNLSSNEFTYDASEHSYAYDRLFHPLAESGGYFTYEWFFNGEKISTEEAIKLKNVSDSGSYSLAVCFHYGKDSSKAYSNIASLKINKAIIDLPVLMDEKYKGEIIKPNIPASSFYIYEDVGFLNAGEYKVKFTLKDRDNYAWRGIEGKTALQSFRILPSKITLKVDDYLLYLFCEVGQANYIIEDGTVFSGDELIIEQKVDGERIILQSKNPNYTLVNNVTKIQRINRLSPEDFDIAFILLISILLVSLFIIFLVLRRNVIRGYFLKNLSKGKKQKNKSVCFVEQKTPAKLEPSAPSAESEGELSVESDPLDFGGMDAEHADELITDSLAKDLLRRSKDFIYTEGSGKEIVNVDTISDNFNSGDRVDVNSLKEKKIISSDTAYIKVLARGEINKSLSVYANGFSLSAIKMIALLGGEAVKVITIKEKKK